MSSDDDNHEPRSLAARIWEREWLRKLGLENVPWQAQWCCPFCRKPRGKVSGRPSAQHQAQESEEAGPPSGIRARTAPARKKRPW